MQIHGRPDHYENPLGKIRDAFFEYSLSTHIKLSALRRRFIGLQLGWVDTCDDEIDDSESDDDGVNAQAALVAAGVYDTNESREPAPKLRRMGGSTFPSLEQITIAKEKAAPLPRVR